MIALETLLDVRSGRRFRSDLTNCFTRRLRVRRSQATLSALGEDRCDPRRPTLPPVERGLLSRRLKFIPAFKARERPSSISVTSVQALQTVAPVVLGYAPTIAGELPHCGQRKNDLS